MQAMKAVLVSGMVAVGLAGCDAQTDSDYAGEPLAKISGKVVTNGVEPKGDIDVAILWRPRARPTDSIEEVPPAAVARAKVRGSFPAEFDLELFDPPPGFDDPSYDEIPANGLIVAIPSENASSSAEVPEILGGAAGVQLTYFQTDGDPSDPESEIMLAAKYYNLEPQKGLHLVRSVVISEAAEAEFFRCDAPNQLCAHFISSSRPTLDQQFFDDEFARCLKYIPDATSCTDYWEPETAAEESEGARCSELVTAQSNAVGEAEAKGSFCKLPWRMETLEEKSSKPLTVTLGVGLAELIHPRFHE